MGNRLTGGGVSLAYQKTLLPHEILSCWHVVLSFFGMVAFFSFMKTVLLVVIRSSGQIGQACVYLGHSSPSTCSLKEVVLSLPFDWHACQFGHLIGLEHLVTMTKHPSWSSWLCKVYAYVCILLNVCVYMFYVYLCSAECMVLQYVLEGGMPLLPTACDHMSV